jgi:hypothetical protein
LELLVDFPGLSQPVAMSALMFVARISLLLLLSDRCGRAARAGRPGSALSLLTRDELPYLLDLHLFLC